MLSAIRDVLLPLTLPRGDSVALYDRLAPRYDRMHRRWLERAGAESLAALQGCLAAELEPGRRVLDAGCGPGTLAHWVMGAEPRADLTLVDLAPAMLERASSVPGRHVHADLLALPFSEAEFDIVICAWALETTAEPDRAVTELIRVLAPGGLLCLCFCTQPVAVGERLRSLPLRLSVRYGFGGLFLQGNFPQWLPHRQPRRLVSRRQLASFACWRKPTGSPAGEAP
ncbi:methyltransferase domain-containing protein [Halomonas sp. LR3S48]|uniref:class I SAM-dependent methyltransferase n=1 Tax=Halomonas sp. LR3S48 TaxID=2982694 RepID=UPI0021E4F370|nr:methyltransferase domain-containing protein [Halomonas sp. LR3S48]UYG05753.1 methyltransferase domain-containing protein [Halomonas sp. LR3S48]